jgi:hypothetical protein
MLLPSIDARPLDERVCSVLDQLALSRRFIDRNLDKFVAWKSRFLKSLSIASIRKRAKAWLPSKEEFDLAIPRKLNQKQ